MSEVYILQDYDRTHGVYTSLELYQEARKRLGMEPDAHPFADELDVLPPLVDGKYGWSVTFCGDKVESVKTSDITEFERYKLHGKCHAYADGLRILVSVLVMANDEESAKQVARQFYDVNRGTIDKTKPWEVLVSAGCRGAESRGLKPDKVNPEIFRDGSFTVIEEPDGSFKVWLMALDHTHSMTLGMDVVREHLKGRK